MGNCVAVNGSLVQKEGDIEQAREAGAIERVRSINSSSLKLEPEMGVDGGKKYKKKKNKTVRFKLHEEEEDENGKGSRGYSSSSKGGGVRIRVVVTQGELIQILNNQSNYSSVEQLLSTIKLKDRKVSHVRTSDYEETNGGWRPALESIPEDH